jgi:hypothetical protein
MWDVALADRRFGLARTLGCSVLGITISPFQKRLAERRARFFGLSDRVRFALTDANELDFAKRRSTQFGASNVAAICSIKNALFGTVRGYCVLEARSVYVSGSRPSHPPTWRTLHWS